MIESLYNIPFYILVPPNVKLRSPSWLKKPSPMFVFSLVLVSYFLVTGGIIYDIIVEPPSVGATVDEKTGFSRPVAFMPYRVNGQYIMEGLASSFLFTIGGIGFIIMDHVYAPGKSGLNRLLLTAMGFIFILVAFFTTWLFMRMKLPTYLQI